MLSAKRFTTTTLLLAAGFILLVPQSRADAGDWVIRGRVIQVDPHNSNNALSVVGLKGLSANTDTVPELDFSYFVTDHWALELILAWSDHEVDPKGPLKAVSTKGIESKALPPTLTLQYHFNPTGRCRPYAGIGLNYTHFFDQDVSPELEAALGSAASVDIDDSFGLAAQVGMDVAIDDRWSVNFDVKYIDMDADATIKAGALRLKSDVDLDPVVWGIGVGYRF